MRALRNRDKATDEADSAEKENAVAQRLRFQIATIYQSIDTSSLARDGVGMRYLTIRDAAKNGPMLVHMAPNVT